MYSLKPWPLAWMRRNYCPDPNMTTFKYGSLVLKSALLLLPLVFYSFPVERIDFSPRLSEIDDIRWRKLLFFDYMRPIIMDENERVLEQRERLLKLYREWFKAGEPLPREHRRWLTALCVEYEVDEPDLDDPQVWKTLIRRVDIVPIRLALAQSASESAWGTSRFAVEGNAMFGQWTYSQPEGMIPEGREPGQQHKVAAFPSKKASVRSYIRNLNTHPAYLEFRLMRRDLREKGLKPDGYTLAKGLIRYSERREEYVAEIKEIIDYNKDLMRIP